MGKKSKSSKAKATKLTPSAAEAPCILSDAPQPDFSNVLKSKWLINVGKQIAAGGDETQRAVADVVRFKEAESSIVDQLSCTDGKVVRSKEELMEWAEGQIPLYEELLKDAKDDLGQDILDEGTKTRSKILSGVYAAHATTNALVTESKDEVLSGMAANADSIKDELRIEGDASRTEQKVTQDAVLSLTKTVEKSFTSLEDLRRELYNSEMGRTARERDDLKLQVAILESRLKALGHTKRVLFEQPAEAPKLPPPSPLGNIVNMPDAVGQTAASVIAHAEKTRRIRERQDKEREAAKSIKKLPPKPNSESTLRALNFLATW